MKNDIYFISIHGRLSTRMKEETLDSVTFSTLVWCLVSFPFLTSTHVYKQQQPKFVIIFVLVTQTKNQCDNVNLVVLVQQSSRVKSKAAT